jgi:hypothetical protein
MCYDVLSDLQDIPETRFSGGPEKGWKRLSQIVIWPDSPFSGLIHHLTAVCGGNVYERSAVEITCSSTHRSNCWQVVDSGWNDWWESNNQTNSWIQFDFKTRSVALTHYTLKSESDGGHHLLEWNLWFDRTAYTASRLSLRRSLLSESALLQCEPEQQSLLRLQLGTIRRSRFRASLDGALPLHELAESDSLHICVIPFSPDNLVVLLDSLEFALELCLSTRLVGSKGCDLSAFVVTMCRGRDSRSACSRAIRSVRS